MRKPQFDLLMTISDVLHEAGYRFLPPRLALILGLEKGLITQPEFEWISREYYP